MTKQESMDHGYEGYYQNNLKTLKIIRSTLEYKQIERCSAYTERRLHGNVYHKLYICHADISCLLNKIEDLGLSDRVKCNKHSNSVYIRIS